MQYPDLRYSNSQRGFPSYGVFNMRNPSDSNLNLPASQNQFNNNRTNPPLPPRVLQPQVEPNSANILNANRSPLMFNAQSPRMKSKVGNESSTVNPVKSWGNLTWKNTTQQSKNETSLLNLGSRQDSSQTDTSNNVDMMAINIKNQPAAKLQNTYKYESLKSLRESQPSPKQQMVNTSKFQVENTKEIDAFGAAKSRESYQPVRETPVYQDNRYLLNEIKMQKNTIENFQEQIMRLNSQVRQFKSNQQGFMKNAEQTRRKSYGNVDTGQMQLNWQQDQSAKLLEQIQKMEKENREKDKLCASSQQLCARYLQNHRKVTKQFEDFKQKAQRESERQLRDTETLTQQVKRLSQTIKDYSIREDNYRSTIEQKDSQISRLSLALQEVRRQLKQKQGLCDAKSIEISKLQLKIQNAETKHRNQVELYAQSQLKIKSHKAQNERIRSELDSQKKKWLLEKNKLEQRQRLLQADKNQAIQRNNKLEEEWNQLNNYINKLKLGFQEQREQFKSKLQEHSEQKQLLDSQISRKSSEGERVRRKLQEKDILIDQMQLTIQEKNTKIRNLEQQIQALKNTASDKQKYKLLTQKQDQIASQIRANDSEHKDKIIAQYKQKISFLTQVVNDNQNKYKAQLQNIKQLLQTVQKQNQLLSAQLKEQKLLRFQLNTKNTKMYREPKTERLSKANFVQSEVAVSKQSAESCQTSKGYVSVDVQSLNQLADLVKVPIQKGDIISSVILGLKKMIEEADQFKQSSENYQQLLDIFGIQLTQNCHELLLVQIQQIRNSLNFLIKNLKEEEATTQKLRTNNKQLQSKLSSQQQNTMKLYQQIRISNQLNSELNEMLMQQAAKLSSIKKQTEQATLIQLQARPMQNEQQFFSVNSFEDIAQGDSNQNA